MLIENPSEYLRLSWQIIIPAVAVSGGFFIFAITMAVRIRLRKPTTGVEGLMGRIGVADSDFQPDGKVLVYGEIWNAESDEAVKKGDKVEVVRVDHLKLLVKKFTPSR